MKAGTLVKVTLKYGEMVGTIIEYNMKKDELGFVTNQCKVNVNGTTYKVYKEDVQEVKYTVKAECKMYQSEDKYERTLWDSNYHRSLQFELTITSEDEATQDYILDKIETSMRNELKEFNFQLSGCPTIENGQYWDCASIEYQHGNMAEIKKTVMTAYKEAKKSLR